MSAWLEAYEQLDEAQKERMQRWLHLQKFISATLRIDWDKWIEQYVAGAMERPFDYSFMQVTVPGFTGGVGAAGQGVSFTKEMDPSVAKVARVPVRARNNLGRLSPQLQDAIAGLLEQGEGAPIKLVAADAAMLQKILPGEKALAKLPKPAFRKLVLARDADDITLTVDGGDEIVRMNVIEFGAVMSRALL